jgi:hypothetical protein
MIIRDLKREPEWGTIWSWRTQDDRPAAYRHNNKGPEVVVGVKGGPTNGLWHHTGPECDPSHQARLIIDRDGGPKPRLSKDWFKKDEQGFWHRYDEDEPFIRAYIESIELPTELP